METLNVVVVCDGEASSATIVMKQLCQHSKHNLTLYQWKPELTSETDILYFHYGGILLEKHPRTLTYLDAPMKKIAGLRGLLTFKRWAVKLNPTHFHDFIGKLDAVSCSNAELQQMFIDVRPDIPTFICHSGVDTELFKPSPPPKHFCIGWAGNAFSGAKMFYNFTKLPFSKRTAGDGIGTYRKFEGMPQFYPLISVYVSVSTEEGSPVPPKEAAACGRPVVAIDVGDLSEWVPEEYLVSTWRELVPIIKQFREDRSLLEVAVSRFRGLSLKWDYSLVAREYDDMFERVVVRQEV